MSTLSGLSLFIDDVLLTEASSSARKPTVYTVPTCTQIRCAKSFIATWAAEPPEARAQYQEVCKVRGSWEARAEEHALRSRREVESAWKNTQRMRSTRWVEAGARVPETIRLLQ